MKVVIMAGGKGTRISSVASDIPKPMIKIEGIPVLEREIKCLKDQGFLFADFKRKVIDIAVREINEKSDIWVRPTYQKTGRAITSIIFEVHNNAYNILNDAEK